MWMTSHCSLQRRTDAVVASSKTCHLKLQMWWHKHSLGVIKVTGTSVTLYLLLCNGLFYALERCGCVWCGGGLCDLLLYFGWFFLVKCSVWEQLNCRNLYRMISASFGFETNQPIGWQDCIHAKISFSFGSDAEEWLFPICDLYFLPVAKQKFAGVLVSSWNFLWQCSFQMFP